MMRTRRNGLKKAIAFGLAVSVLFGTIIIVNETCESPVLHCGNAYFARQLIYEHDGMKVVINGEGCEVYEFQGSHTVSDVKE